MEDRATGQGDTAAGERPSTRFAASVGLLGWALLAATALVPGFGPDSVARPDVLAYALFFVVLVATRAMAFHMVSEVVVALDAAFYVAAAVCLGSGAAGRLVALSLSVDALSRVLRASPGSSRRDSLIFALYFGGMTGALLLGIGWLLDLDSLYVLAGVADPVVIVRVLAAGLVFLAAHYAIQGLRARLDGSSFRRYLARIGLPGIATEAALLPLAAIIVFIYHPDQPLKFALLGTTYLIVNYAFSRMASARVALERRVSELETLNVIAHRLGTCLQVAELVGIVVREIGAAIPAAELVVIARRERAAGALVVDAFKRADGSFSRLHTRAGEGLTGHVMTTGRELLIGDLRAMPPELEPPDHGIRSFLGVPLDIYGQPDGVLAIQSHDAFAFSIDEQRLLKAIAAQVAVALENARLYELAMVDGLTGLFVRRYFDARLGEEVERSRRFAADFSIVMMDVDDFKQLNDTHGHPAGDRILRAIGEVLRRQMRGVDTAARYGGEEFAMILPRTSMVEAYNQAERLRRDLEEVRIVADGEVIRMTASFGIASFQGSGAASGEELVKLADTALYRAKRTGKNRVELYWADQDERAPLKSV
jgi:diguanylate cyclase (GGDEF)-like protein